MEREQSLRPFDPKQFDYWRFLPSNVQQYLREQPVPTAMIDYSLRQIAEEHPDIPEPCYEAFFMMQSVIAQVHGPAKLENPRIYVPIIYQAYKGLQENGLNTDLVNIQLTAAAVLLDGSAKKMSESPYSSAAQREADALSSIAGFFIDFAECVRELEHRGPLNIDMTRQL